MILFLNATYAACSCRKGGRPRHIEWDSAIYYCDTLYRDILRKPPGDRYDTSYRAICIYVLQAIHDHKNWLAHKQVPGRVLTAAARNEKSCGLAGLVRACDSAEFNRIRL